MDIIQFISDIDAFVWGPPMIVLLLGSHLFLTFRTGFIPVSYTHLTLPTT